MRSTDLPASSQLRVVPPVQRLRDECVCGVGWNRLPAWLGATLAGRLDAKPFEMSDGNPRRISNDLLRRLGSQQDEQAEHRRREEAHLRTNVYRAPKLSCVLCVRQRRLERGGQTLEVALDEPSGARASARPGPCRNEHPADPRDVRVASPRLRSDDERDRTRSTTPESASEGDWCRPRAMLSLIAWRN